MLEREWQAKVLEAAAWHGFALTYHPPANRPGRNGRIQAVVPGFPDLILLKGSRLLAVELKTERGYLSPDQRRWLVGLEAAGVEVDVWRPGDLEVALEILAGRRAGRGVPVLATR